MEQMRRSVEHLESLANLMDSRFNIPGTNFPIGLDTIIGLVPGVGDTASLAVAGYIVVQARRAGLPKRHTGRMVWNVFIDWLIGLVPVIGDLFDWGFRANNRNAAIFRAHYERELARRGADPATMLDAGGTSTLT